MYRGISTADSFKRQQQAITNVSVDGARLLPCCAATGYVSVSTVAASVSQTYTLHWDQNLKIRVVATVYVSVFHSIGITAKAGGIKILGSGSIQSLTNGSEQIVPYPVISNYSIKDMRQLNTIYMKMIQVCRRPLQERQRHSCRGLVIITMQLQ